jgi:cellulose synthase/poly-beta-1,6-N-acetylglucosamine synthase-like glycosyltransferase
VNRLETLILVFNGFVLAYFVVLNVSYLLLLYSAGRELFGFMHRSRIESPDELMRSPLTPGVTIIAPAWNEALGVVDSVRSLLSLEYPDFQVVVVSDGSTDDTMEKLIAAFELEQVEYAYAPDVPTAPFRALYRSRIEQRVTVVDKDNGGKADAINCGINVADTPLVCVIDADSVLDMDALSKAARPFVDDPERTVAVGGIVRIINDSLVERGHVREVRLPRAHLARIQVMEYLRAFLAGRSGWSRVNGLLIISGAFGVFRRDVVAEVGGFHPHTLGEDMELVVRIHRHLREQRRPYRVVFIPDRVCWTEAPEDLRNLRTQRIRWHRGLTDVLRIHRGMALRPRYGAAGMFAMPHFVLFEWLAPVVELLGVLLVPISWWLGYVSNAFALAFVALALLFGIFLSVAALTLEELALRRYPSVKQLLLLVTYALVENLGYRQVTAWWRIRGLARELRRSEATWGSLERKGFGTGE